MLVNVFALGVMLKSVVIRAPTGSPPRATRRRTTEPSSGTASALQTTSVATARAAAELADVDLAAAAERAMRHMAWRRPPTSGGGSTGRTLLFPYGWNRRAGSTCRTSASAAASNAGLHHQTMRGGCMATAAWGTRPPLSHKFEGGPIRLGPTARWGLAAPATGATCKPLRSTTVAAASASLRRVAATGEDMAMLQDEGGRLVQAAPRLPDGPMKTLWPTSAGPLTTMPSGLRGGGAYLEEVRKGWRRRQTASRR